MVADTRRQHDLDAVAWPRVTGIRRIDPAAGRRGRFGSDVTLHAGKGRRGPHLLGLPQVPAVVRDDDRKGLREAETQKGNGG